MTNELSASIDGQSLPFEEIPVTASTLPVPTLTNEQRIKNECAQFDLAEAVVFAKWEEYKGLTINGVDDRETEKKVKEGEKWFRDRRVAVEKKRKALKSDYLEVGRGIDGHAAKLTGLLLTPEATLRAELDRIEDLRNAEKTRKEREAQEKLQGRVNELIANGMAFNGSYYAIGATISIDVVTLKDMPDEVYKGMLAGVRAENQRIIDEKKAADDAAEAERQAQQLLKEENERQAAKLKEQEDKIKATIDKMRRKIITDFSLDPDCAAGKVVLALSDDDFDLWAKQTADAIEEKKKQDVEKAVLQKRTSDRIAELKEIGFEQRYDRFMLCYRYAEIDSIDVSWGKIAELNDDDWAEHIKDIVYVDGFNKAEEKAMGERLALEASERQEKQQTFKNRHLQLILLKGFVSSPATQSFVRKFKYPKLIEDISILATTVLDSTPEQWDYLCSVHDDLIERRNQAVAAEDKRLADELEADRIAGLSDSEKIREWATRVNTEISSFPALKSKKRSALFVLDLDILQEAMKAFI